MSIENYKDPIVSQWNKYAKIVENESHVVTSGMFALTGLPDIQQRVVINGYVEIGDRDKIESSDEFKVDYTNGYVFMHSSKEGETINVAKYASRGINYYPASRVWTKLTADGDIYETLEDIANEIDGALELSREIQSEENIRIENEDIRISSEEARNISEQERILSEVTRRSNESTRENNETDRIDDENIRIQAEITRVQSELARESNEADRIELKLVLDTLKLQLENLENNITNSESVRVENENIRISNEETRVADELTRTTSEQDRVDSEVARKSDEIERSNAEQLRLEAEIIRIQDELVRVSNEDGRILLKTQLDELKTQLEELRDGLTSGNFGDMFKIMYDTNNNGKVDIAENSEKLEGKSLAEIYEDIPEGTTVEDSTTNGNIVVNGAEIQVYDDSTVEGNISDLAGEGRTTETVKDNSDKIGILSTKVSPETLLDTTSQDLSGAINEVNTKLGAHEAEMTTQLLNRVKKDGDALDGVYKIGNSYQNILSYSGHSRKIVTNITFDLYLRYTIILEGKKHDAGTVDFRPFYLTLSLTPYTTSDYYASVSSINTYKPEVKFGQENGKLVIFINDFQTKTFNIKCISTNQNIDAFKNWNVVNEEIVGTAYTVPYI